MFDKLGALLGIVPMAEKSMIGSSNEQSDGQDTAPASSLLHLGDNAETLKRPDINARLQGNLRRFWQAHGIDFALFWLMKPPEEQTAFLKRACPDMLKRPKQPGEQCKPTDLLLPELCTEMLLAQHGRTLVALCQTRALEDVSDADLKLVARLDTQGVMPIFSGVEVNGDASAGEDAFAGALAFVHNGKIVVCGVEKNGDDGKKLEVTRRLVASGKVMDANQWITRNVRQTILLSFCCALGDMYLADKGIIMIDAAGKEGTKGAADQRLASVEKVIDRLGGLKTEETGALPGKERGKAGTAEQTEPSSGAEQGQADKTEKSKDKDQNES